MIALRDGMHVESKGIIDEMGSQDVIIKGANAIDPRGWLELCRGPPHGGMSGGINLVIRWVLKNPFIFCDKDFEKDRGTALQ